MSDAVSVRPKDWVHYQCRLCGNCCRNLKNQLMLEPLDAYHLARYLRERGEVEFIEDVFSRYTSPMTLEECFPIFVMKTTEPDDTCVFLKDGRCSVYEARPRTCRMYPFTAVPGQRGKAFEYLKCVDSHAAHFSEGRILVKDWVYQNFKTDAREFLSAESRILSELREPFRALGAEKMEKYLFKILFHRYYDYDLDQPFMQQYVRNMETLKGVLQTALES